MIYIVLDSSHLADPLFSEKDSWHLPDKDFFYYHPIRI